MIWKIRREADIILIITKTKISKNGGFSIRFRFYRRKCFIDFIRVQQIFVGEEA